MGLLGKLFGGEPEHQPLDPSGQAAVQLEKNKTALEGLAKKTKDKLEVVPGEQGLWVFVGKPPSTFGLVWFQDGREGNLKLLMKEKGLSAAKVQTVSDHLRDAYVRHKDEPRYAWNVAGRPVVVTPSPLLEKAVLGIIQEA
jgi:hypothetical protein